MQRGAWGLVLTFAIGLAAGQVQAQLRIVDYNTAGDVRPGMNAVLTAIAADSVNGVAKPIDVLILQEQDSMSTTTQGMVNVLNGIYGSGAYNRGTMDAATSGAGRPGLVYNTQTLQLVSETKTGTVSGSGNARQGMLYRLHPLGYGDDADFYVFSNHYKAGDTSTDKSRRNVEAQSVRALGDALPAGSHIIYAGDYNVQSASEQSIQTMIAPGNGQAVDPINLTTVSGSPVTWHDSNSLRYAHTQSPVDASLPGAGSLVTGGMDDRFDFQYVTAAMMDGEGLSYIGPGVGNSPATTASYHAFGNNGSQPLNHPINDPLNNIALSDAVLDALASVTDHLPVVADYQLPAKMSVSVAPPPARVLVGANLSVGVSVSNSASVVAAVGADELDYMVSGQGAVAGGAAGTDSALGGVNNHLLNADTSAAGAMSGAVNASSSSQAVANGSFTQPISYDVLAHANATFDALADVNSLAINLGDFFVGSGVKSLPIHLHNLVAAAGYTAELDIDGIDGTGDTNRLSTDLALASVAAGDALDAWAMLDTLAIGNFTARWTLSTSDENLLGATAGTDLVLDLSGRVAHLGDVNFDGSVNIFDVNLVSGAWGSPGPAADANSDGVVDIFDVNVVSANWSGGMEGGAAVPEPTALGLAAVGASVVLGLWIIRASQ